MPESERILRCGFDHAFHQLPGVDRHQARDFRMSVRKRTHVGQTSGCAAGFLQANFVGLPKEYAFDFLLFCLRNSRPCPLLEVIECGSAEPVSLAPGADITTDIPRYRVYKNGAFAESRDSVTDIWFESTQPPSDNNIKAASSGMVGFLLGCSFSWEQALCDAGHTPRHIEQGCTVPMYRTNRPNTPAGPFAGFLVVSMRPYRPDQLAAVTAITARFPSAHGAPLHAGDPEALGIDPSRLGRPDYGDPVEVRAGEVPVFWACGVTPQTALEAARLPVAVTHEPGHMFVTDVLVEESAAAGQPPN